jgi:hypothetical protein
MTLRALSVATAAFVGTYPQDLNVVVVDSIAVLSPN